jgi:rubrerythrin
MAYDPVTGERTGGPEPMPKKGRAERLETFREVDKEQKERAELEKARATHFLVESLKKALEDERSAKSMYENLINEAEGAGYPVVAEALRKIVRDEHRHYGILDSMIRESMIREYERGRY